MSRTPEQLVRDFCAAWPRLDVDELMSYFTGDAVSHNMPGPPTNGAEAIRASIAGFLGNWQRTQWDILNIAASGNVVFTERVDRIDTNGKHIDLPVAGVFEIEGEKIRAWRDYFDLQTYRRAIQ
jgi:limonene-1,2-epoxide hydrolase